MRRSCGAFLALVFTIAAAVRPSEAGTVRKRLSREETVDLFGKLHDAAALARTFQAGIRRTEKTGLVEDAEPLEYRGRVSIVRPDRFRQEITSPRRSLTVVSATDLWVYFPEAREVQHVDLDRGIKDREETSAKSIMPWLTFDFEGLDARFSIAAVRLPVPEGVVVRKVPARSPGEGGAVQEGAGESAASPPPAPPAEPVAVPSPYVYEITFEPKKAEYAPNMVQLVLTVYGGEPWPLRIKQESEDELIITEFSDIVLDAPIPDETFEFKPPRGTKVTDLSG